MDDLIPDDPVTRKRHAAELRVRRQRAKEAERHALQTLKDLVVPLFRDGVTRYEIHQTTGLSRDVINDVLQVAGIAPNQQSSWLTEAQKKIRETTMYGQT